MRGCPLKYCLIGIISLSMCGCAHSIPNDGSSTQNVGIESTLSVSDSLGYSESSTVSTDSEYPNLNFEDGAIRNLKSQSGKLYTIKIEQPEIGENRLEELKESLKAFGFTPDNKDFLFDLVDDEARRLVSPDEMTSADYPICNWIWYNTPDFHLDSHLTRWVELCNNKNVREILGEGAEIDDEAIASWRPYYNGKKIISGSLENGKIVTDAYNLNGKGVSVNDALKFASDLLNSGKLTNICPKIYSYEPISYEVLEYENGACGYEFVYAQSYDGVCVDPNIGSVIEPKGLTLIEGYTTVFMSMENSVDYMWSTRLCTEKISSTEEIEKKIEFDDACKIVSEKLSRERTFNVNSAGLAYLVFFEDDKDTGYGFNSTLTLKPVWQFVMKGVNVPEYRNIAAYVDVQTGELILKSI